MKDTLEIVKQSKFYTELNTLLREQLPRIKRDIDPEYERILKENQFQHPLPVIHQFEYASWGSNKQWRLELDFDEYQWSNETIKPHFLNALVFLDIGAESIHFKYQLCNSFNAFLKPSASEKIPIKKLNENEFVLQKINEVSHFLKDVPKLFIEEIKKINFNELEYMGYEEATIQEKWKEGKVIGYDCIAYGDGSVIIANTYEAIMTETNKSKRWWFPLCDTSLNGIEKYEEDIWTEIDIYHGAFEYNNQKIVFGPGAMGNEGYIASTALTGELNWSIFFTFSNPIHKAEVKDEHLICYGDTGAIIDIDLKDITKIKILQQNDWARS